MSRTAEAAAVKVVVVEDDEIARVALAEQLGDAGHTVRACATSEEALSVMDKESFDVAITDVRLPGMDGITFLERVREISPRTVVLVLTGFGAVDEAVKAMKIGAADYLCKPVSADEIEMRISRALALRDAESDRDRLQQEVERMYSYHSIVGRTDEMQEIFRLIELVKDVDSTVLIEGETGTGKERVARALHFASWRREQPFVGVNCMILSRTLLESELFGHERGAFTGAVKSQPGRFEIAGRGTVLLDDVDDIPLDLQGKLVNVLEQHKCERVGSSQQVDLQCRVVCATKANLSELVAQGRFRDDLYYRMNVVKIHVPPLRQRRADIPWLAEHFLAMYNERLGRDLKGISPEAMQVLHAYDWPGNVRELEHAIERAVALSRGTHITPADLSDTLGRRDGDALFALRLPAEGKVDLQKLLSDVEAEVIEWATALSKGQQTRAAELLNLPRTTLQAKLAKHKEQ